MSCRDVAGDVQGDCRESVDNAVNDCTTNSELRIRVYRETADQAREECEEERSRECSDWGERTRSECCDWQPCKFFCNVVTTFVEVICVARVWITELVCRVVHTIVEIIRIAWEVIVSSACRVGGVILTGLCAVAGALLGFGCALVWLGTARIIESLDEPTLELEKEGERLSAECMSIAHVDSETSFRDSGIHYLFRIDNGVVQFRTIDEPWKNLAPDGSSPKAVSYRDLRRGVETPAPSFNMVAANSGRVFAKEIGYAKFYMTMIEPMFKWKDNEDVPSMYFKLDPEQGDPKANDKDRLDHLNVPDSMHPAAVRFPLFRYSLSLDLNDSMIVHVDQRLLHWHRIDARPPKDGKPPPDDDGFPPIDVVVKYQPPIPLIPVTQVWGYRLKRVLDIGVGHVHWHEHRCSVYGGELDSLDGPGLKVCLEGRNAYRLFNGPVDDQGGFIDGTVNYYVLGQFIDGDWGDDERIPRNAFGILWLDEQAVLSERWRLLDPDDSKFGGFKELVPSSIVQYLQLDFDYKNFHFNREKYWCPMRARHVTPRSRMAVSRQVVVVSGRDPDTHLWELYSINFSFGTSDRTWRWRGLPRLENDNAGFAPPEEFGLREDMTLWVKETYSGGVRYWYQRYLPANAQPTPEGGGLKPPQDVDQPDRDFSGSKPDAPIFYPWQSLPSDVFEFARVRVSHFGCYENHVNWRSQYYRVTVLEGEEFLQDNAVDEQWEAVDDDNLFIEQDSIDWRRLNNILKGETDEQVSADLVQRVIILASAIPGAVSGAFSGVLSDILFGALSVAKDVTAVQKVLCGIYDELRESPLIIRRHTHGLFHPRFLLSLRYRKPLGWIMVHWDKRDDDLLPFRDIAKKSGKPFDVTLKKAGGEPTIQVRVESYHRVDDAPQINLAKVTFTRIANDSARLRVEILPCKEGREFDKNVWRIKLGALTRDSSGTLTNFECLLSKTRDLADQTSISANGWHMYEWVINQEIDTLDRIAQCCTERGRQRFATSLWFEDVVGHVATADTSEFRTSESGD